VEAAIAFLLAYLIGSVDFGVIVPRVMGIDIYDHGSGNPGTSNVFRTLGKRAAAAVLVGDLLKGLAAAALGALWLGEVAGFACGFAAVLGHVFPVWHRFKGGRGVATAIGAALWLAPLFGLVLAVGWGGVVIATKTASIASLVAMVVYVPGFALAGHRGASLFWAAATAILVLARHSANIRRIVLRQERTVSPA
jgi:glycerol-3-phosphate acyltransferase PlsY